MKTGLAHVTLYSLHKQRLAQKIFAFFLGAAASFRCLRLTPLGCEKFKPQKAQTLHQQATAFACVTANVLTSQQRMKKTQHD